MTTTPKEKQGRSSSPKAGMTSFKNGLGKNIPAEAFENDYAPGKPKLSEGGKKKFDAETAAIKKAAKSLSK